MNYEAMIAETDKMLRGIMLRERIWMGVLIGLSVLLTVLAIVMMVQAHKAHKAERVQKVVGGYEYRPQITEDVQVVNGVEFRRMGVPGRG